MGTPQFFRQLLSLIHLVKMHFTGFKQAKVFFSTVKGLFFLPVQFVGQHSAVSAISAAAECCRLSLPDNFRSLNQSINK